MRLSFQYFYDGLSEFPTDGFRILILVARHVTVIFTSFNVVYLFFIFFVDRATVKNISEICIRNLCLSLQLDAIQNSILKSQKLTRERKEENFYQEF